MVHIGNPGLADTACVLQGAYQVAKDLRHSFMFRSFFGSMVCRDCSSRGPTRPENRNRSTKRGERVGRRDRRLGGRRHGGGDRSISGIPRLVGGGEPQLRRSRTGPLISRLLGMEGKAMRACQMRIASGASDRPPRRRRALAPSARLPGERRVVLPERLLRASVGRRPEHA
jgi:hypothetical protein